MNKVLWNQLKSLGLLPANGMLSRNGSTMLLNLEKFWMQHLSQHHSILTTPNSLSTDLHQRYSSVSYSEKCEVTESYLSQKCARCTEGDMQACCDTFDTSTLEFTEDIHLHTFRFYPEPAFHSGLIELDSPSVTKASFHKCLKNFGDSDFSIDKRDSAASVILQSPKSDVRLLLQDLSYAQWRDNYYVLKSTLYINNWYLTILIDKFHKLHDSSFHPLIAPYCVAIIPSDNENEDIANLTNYLHQQLNQVSIASRIFTTTESSSQLGIPFDIKVDKASVTDGVITVFSRFNNEHHTIPNVHKVPDVFKLYWNSVIDY